MLCRNALGERRGVTDSESSHWEGPAQGPSSGMTCREAAQTSRGEDRRPAPCRRPQWGPVSGSTVSSAGLGRAGGSTSVSCFHSEDWPASQAFQLLPVQKQGLHSPPPGLRGLGSLPAAKSFLEPLHCCLHQTPQALLSDDSGAEQPSVWKVQDPSSEGRPRGPRCQPAQGKPRRLLWT